MAVPCYYFSADSVWIALKFFKKILFALFLERVEEKEKERERNINVWLPLMCPLPGTWPTTQACALTGNRTREPLVHRSMAQSTELHQLGPSCFSMCILSLSWNSNIYIFMFYFYHLIKIFLFYLLSYFDSRVGFS